MPLDAETVKNLVDSLIEANKSLKRMAKSAAYATEKVEDAIHTHGEGHPSVEKLRRAEGLKINTLMSQRRHVEALEKKALNSWK